VGLRLLSGAVELGLNFLIAQTIRTRRSKSLVSTSAGCLRKRQATGGLFRRQKLNRHIAACRLEVKICSDENTLTRRSGQLETKRIHLGSASFQFNQRCAHGPIPIRRHNLKQTPSLVGTFVPGIQFVAFLEDNLL
jgi:hypothetical protein